MTGHDSIQALKLEGQRALTLLAQYADVVGDDDEVAAALIEGQTSLVEVIGMVVERIQEIEGHLEVLVARASTLAARRQRLERQAQSLRAAVVVGMADGGLKKLELPIATLSRMQPRARVVIQDESLIPAGYWRAGAPKLDHRKLCSALADGESVPGATLGNGGETLMIREA